MPLGQPGAIFGGRYDDLEGAPMAEHRFGEPRIGFIPSPLRVAVPHDVPQHRDERRGVRGRLLAADRCVAPGLVQALDLAVVGHRV